MSDNSNTRNSNNPKVERKSLAGLENLRPENCTSNNTGNTSQDSSSSSNQNSSENE